MMKIMTNVIVTLCLIVALVKSEAASAAFSDVPAFHPYREAIEYLEAKGIVQKGRTFRPDQRLNQVEFLAMLVNTLYPQEIAKCTKVPFRNVQPTDWYVKYICVAAKHNLADGGTEFFSLDQNMPFTQVAKIVAQSMNLMTTVPPHDPLSKAHIEALATAKAIPTSIQGLSHRVTRAELAEMIYRLRAKITHKQSHTFQSLAKRSVELPSTGFLYTQRLEEDGPSGQRGNTHFLYAYDTQAKQSKFLGNLPIGWHGSAFALQDGKVYFIANDVDANGGDIKFFDIRTGTVSKVPLPGITDGSDDYESIASDMVLSGNQLMYLKGVCAEGGSCSLHLFDIQTKRGEVLLEKLPQGRSGWTLERFDVPRKTVVLVNVYGDGGHISKSRYEFNLSAKSFKQVASAHQQYCGEPGESSCPAKERAENARYEKLFPDSLSYCNGLVGTKPYPDYEVLFVRVPSGIMEFAASHFVSCL